MPNTTRVPRQLALIAVALIASPLLAGDPPELESDQPIRVATNGGVGLLASPNSYKTIPVGCAHVFNGARPDVFVSASRGVVRALNLYRWLRDNEQGQPVFAPPVSVKHPFGPDLPDGTILQDSNGGVHGFWFKGKTLVHCDFDKAKLEFVQRAQLDIKALPRSPGSLAIVSMDDKRIELIAGLSNGVSAQPSGERSSDDYVLYNGAGMFRGKWPSVGLYRISVKPDLSQLLSPPSLVSQTSQEILGGSAQLTTVSYENPKCSGVIAGSHFGNLYFFASDDSSSARLHPKETLFIDAGYSIRHPTIGCTPIAFPRANGQACDLLAGGEGALFFYQYRDQLDPAGHPVYFDAQPVWQTDAEVFAGTLPVPNVVDWDGDNLLDLVVGNSEGLILFFKNFGDNLHPKFGVGAPLTANGETIHIQPGYYDVQGPFEARWGYTCPTVADWNRDGLPDILLSSATAAHQVYLNRGTRQKPELAAAHPIYSDGLDLHGSWRVKPGVAKIDGRMAYVIQDDTNALHLYWRIDNYNVENGGQLKLTDGSIITSHITGADTWLGQYGRSKIDIVDWDGDGKLDLLVGTGKRGSLPQPNTGLPWSRRRKIPSLQVVYLRNVGTNSAPSYEYPRQLQFRGEDVYHGAHANSPVACMLGPIDDGKPNLLIGMESGRIYFYKHNDITFFDSATASPKAPSTKSKETDNDKE